MCFLRAGKPGAKAFFRIAFARASNLTAANCVRVVALVCVVNVAVGKLHDQVCARRAIGDLSACEHEGERTAFGVSQRVDLGRPAPTRTPNRLIFLPTFPPAAERCAFTAELSIST